jgi:hypothetical protein
LLVLGRTGAADVIFVEPVAPGQVRLGYDHWSVGGPRTEPFRVIPGQSVRITVHSPSLLPAARSMAARTVTIIVDGKTYLAAQLPWYPIAPAEIVIGRNRIGASSCTPIFSGHIRRLP